MRNEGIQAPITPSPEGFEPELTPKQDKEQVNPMGEAFSTGREGEDESRRACRGDNGRGQGVLRVDEGNGDT